LLHVKPLAQAMNPLESEALKQAEHSSISTPRLSEVSSLCCRRQSIKRSRVASLEQVLSGGRTHQNSFYLHYLGVFYSANSALLTGRL
jgi:hypothetical protein